MFADFWGQEPIILKLLHLAIFTLAASTVVRFIRLAGILYVHFGHSFSHEKIIKGQADPDTLARYALSNRAPLTAVSDFACRIQTSADRAGPPTVIASAHNKFLYLCERCAVDVESTRRAGSLTLLLSLMTFAFGAVPTYLSKSNNSRFTESYILFETVEQVLTTFGIGLTVCALINFFSGVFERKLSLRIADWRYFFARISDLE